MTPHRSFAALLCLAVLAACVQASMTTPSPAAAAVLTAGMRCTAQTLSRLYFGLDTPDGPLSDAAWQAFVQAEIAPRLPAGYTLLQAQGQWRDAAGAVMQEDSRVLEVVGLDGLAERQALAEIVGRYKARFKQQSVLVTQAPVRACT
jgi:Protein of unknown function (DUF3574)